MLVVFPGVVKRGGIVFTLAAMLVACASSSSPKIKQNTLTDADFSYINVPFAIPRKGKIDGVKIWQLPDSPDGDKADQSWLAVGNDAYGDIYISGHDHQYNSMLYRLYQGDDSLRWIGDARSASKAANNWLNDETAEKFHTRPIHHDGRVYVATLDNSNMNKGFLRTRGFHWYGYDLESNVFLDLSAREPDGVGAKTVQLVTIQKDPVNNLLYGMSIPENKLVVYDITAAKTTVLGKPTAWPEYFYSNRFMWVDSRGRVYISGGSSRHQWHQGESEKIFNHIWYYDPKSGFGELTSFSLQGPNAMEIGQWDRRRENLYTSDDQGNIYRFNDAAASWTFLGRPDFSSAFKTWILQLSADGEKIYIGNSNGFGRNSIYEFDIATGNSFELLSIRELDKRAAAKDFIAGYDSWDSRGNFYIADFSMNDGDNVYMLGINPVRIKVSKKILPELVAVSVTAQGEKIHISRTGKSLNDLQVLYEVRRFDDQGQWVKTIYGELLMPAQQSTIRIEPATLQLPDNELGNATFVIIEDGNDYVVGDNREIPLVNIKNN